MGLVLHVASELAPLAKAGGLGDVVYGLSKELIKLGQEVLLVLPKYRHLKTEEISSLHCTFKKTFHLADSRPFEVFFWKGSYQGISLILIDPQSPEAIFQRESIYGEADDIDRFLLFCFLTVEYLSLYPPLCSSLHLHDWPTAFIAYLCKKYYFNKLPRYKIILTIHNILHQGRALPQHLVRFGIELTPDLEDPAESRLINLLKSGLLCADHIVTVSPTYAREITTHAFGYHLNSVLAAHPEKLSGILNGIDLNYWNPKSDPALVMHYSPSDAVTAIIKAKEKNKAHLQHILHLPISSAPLVGCITRLDTQKGPHLIAHAIATILEKGGQCVLLGQVADPNIHKEFLLLKERYAKNPSFHFHDRFNETLARIIYAAADFIIIPSLFEPCGLTQMIAMRYATIPIVRTTGGLADTVHDIDNTAVPSEKKVGICFHDMNQEQLDHALDRAFHLYQDKIALQKTLKNIARQDFSWKESAKKYLKLYQS